MKRTKKATYICVFIRTVGPDLYSHPQAFLAGETGEKNHRIDFGKAGLENLLHSGVTTTSLMGRAAATRAAALAFVLLLALLPGVLLLPTATAARSASLEFSPMDFKEMRVSESCLPQAPFPRADPPPLSFPTPPSVLPLRWTSPSCCCSPFSRSAPPSSAASPTVPLFVHGHLTSS